MNAIKGRRYYYYLLAITVIIMLSAVGCAKPYIPPVIEPEDINKQRFDGLLTLLSQHNSVHIIWIHGMCPHTRENWADPRVKKLAERIGVSTDEVLKAKSLGDFVYRYSISFKGKPITLDMVVWSELIDKRRASLCFDSRHADKGLTHEACGDNANYPHKRAKINDAIKSGLMNSCLSDAMIYVGAQGASVRDRLRPEIESALATSPDTGRTPLLLISESLGSKVMFDTLLEIVDKQATNIEKSPVLQNIANTTQIMMLANQIPILDLTNPDPESFKFDASKAHQVGSSLQRTVQSLNRLRLLRIKKPDVEIEKLKVIAFSDPNDVLSYRLPLDYFSDRSDIDVINILPSNDYVWFRLFENPLNAHTDYLETGEVSNHLLCGNPIDDECLSNITP